MPAIDTGIYDPDHHDNHIVAMYDTDDAAREAQRQLVGIGLPATSIQVVSKSRNPAAIDHAEDHRSIWEAMAALFMPSEDRSALGHAVGRGHAMLVVTPSPNIDRHTLVHTLEMSGPVDFDARLEEWRQEGYDTLLAQSTNPAAAQPERVGQREDLPGAVRVRSYLAPRQPDLGLTPGGPTAVVHSNTTAAEPAMRQFNSNGR